jgi:serine protease Do
MNLPNALKQPIVAAVVGALTIAVPVGAVYVAGAGRTVTAATPAPVIPVPAAANPGAMLPDFSSMVQRYGPAVVNIAVVTKVSAAYSQQGDDDSDDSDDNGNDDNGRGNGGGNDGNPFGPNGPLAPFFRGLPHMQPQQQQPMRGEGSGFIIRPDGYIMTNAHVVNGASEVTVRMTDRREYTAKVVGVDTKSDIAIIKIAATNLPTVKLGDSHDLKVGEWVLAIGAPFGFENSATAGIVSAKGRSLGGGEYVPFIQTDVPINPGNSGGPLFNMRGEVVGVNSQIYSRSGGYMGVSFSIPIDVAMQVGQQLQTTGHASHGKLGVQIQNVTQGLADSFGLPQPEGALVSQIVKDGPAEHAGLEPGDVILKVNGQPLKGSDELPSLIASIAPGTTVKLEVWRSHETREIPVKLGSMDEKHQMASNAPQEQGGKLGLSVRPLTPEEQQQTQQKGGLLVQKSRGPAQEAGIEPGDVVIAANGAAITSADDLKSAVEKSKGHIALLIKRGDQRLFVPVRVG